VLEEARDGLVKWGTANALTLDRSAIERLTMDQLDGLKAAAQRGKAAFVPAAVSVGLMAAAAADEAAGKLPAPDKEKGGKKAAKGPDPREEPDFGPRPRTQQQDTREDPPHDPETGEIAKGTEDKAAPVQTQTESTGKTAAAKTLF
jgi:hypothetical protein